MKSTERINPPSERMTMAATYPFGEKYSHRFIKRGDFIIDLFDENGSNIMHYEAPNLIVYDAGILGAYQITGTLPARNVTMLAIGSGATGSLLSPDSPDPRQRSLNNEIARKEFTTTQYVDSTGATAGVPTHVVDYSVVFGVGEAVGALNEMALVAPFNADPLVKTPNPDTFPSYNETVDLRNYDIIVNYASFPVVNKPNNATLSITWRLTF